MMCRLISILFFLFLVKVSPGQLLDSAALDSAREYTSLEEALKHPDQVYVLNLKRERLKEFPAEILQLKNLNVLDLSRNKLEELPSELGQLQYLQHIDIEKNRFETFPAVLSELPQLKRLIFSQNDIDSIPDSIKNLKELRVIEAWSTNLLYLSPFLADLEHLEMMELRVINFTERERNYILNLLPDVEIMMSNGCDCGG